MKILLIPFLAMICLFTSCSKQPKPVYTIEGRLFYDCNNVPLVYTDISLFGIKPMSSEFIAEATTDENGYFQLTYERFGGGASSPSLSIHTGSINSATSKTILKRVPSNVDILIDTLYLEEVGALLVYLEANEPYTSSDTLYVNVPFSDAGDGTLNSHFTDTFAGPFYTSFLKEYIVNKNQNWYQSSEKRNITWYINKYIKEEAKDHTFEIYGCNQSDSVTITIP